MTAPSKAWELSVDDRIEHIARELEKNPDFSNTSVPGLKELLLDYISPDVEVKSLEFHQRLLRTFRDSQDNTYQDILSALNPEEQQQIERFVAGEKPENLSDNFILGPSLGCREELSKLQHAESIAHISSLGVTKTKSPHEGCMSRTTDWFIGVIEKLAEVFHHHEDEPAIQVYKDAPFQNWGLNVKNTPYLTCVPSSVKAIQLIVEVAKRQNLSVRCSGYRHSWAPIFGSDGQILISMLNVHTVTTLPNTASLPGKEPKPNELEEIKIVPGQPRTPGNTLVRVGCATTNERLRRWCVKNNKVTLPLNVIMVEITLGGSNAPICHGAGRQHQTLSDLVRKIEYVDANGKLQSVEKPEHLRAASGCFGLMGVVTHITLELSPMTYAMLAPKKMPVIRAVPPPPGMDEKLIPKPLLKYWKDMSLEEKQKCQQEFEERATSDYYAEWFWFPYSDYCWVNTWNNTTDPQGTEPFPDDAHIFFSFVETFAMNILQNTPLLPELVHVVHLSEAAVTLISRLAMKQLSDKPVKTFLPDGLHFQRAIQNVRVCDVEVEMPLVAKVGGPANAINFAPVQQAWWDAILLTYKHSYVCPMTMPLEMRIMGGSEVIMAPQRGNTLGTCSIEVLTLHHKAEVWPPFAQEVLDKWLALKDPATGKRLKTRPHWAKEWYGYEVDGMPWVERLRTADYKDERREFLQILGEIGKEAGWTLEDLKKRFSNDFFNHFFFS